MAGRLRLEILAWLLLKEGKELLGSSTAQDAKVDGSTLCSRSILT